MIALFTPGMSMMSFIQRAFNVHRGISFIHRRHDRKNNSS